MCTQSGIDFGTANLSRAEIEGKEILELGAYNVNGTLRDVIVSLGPKHYVGVDIAPGPGVDVVCDADEIVERFGPESADVVISTEMLEHVRDWKRTISNIKRVCRANGIMLVTTRSFGFVYHPHPLDCWRYEVDDMKNIFSDCIIERIEKDPSAPGVMVKVRKPADFRERDLSDYRLFSVLLNDRVVAIDDRDIGNTPTAYRRSRHRWMRRQRLKKLARRLLRLPAA